MLHSYSYAIILHVIITQLRRQGTRLPSMLAGKPIHHAMGKVSVVLKLSCSSYSSYLGYLQASRLLKNFLSKTNWFGSYIGRMRNIYMFGLNRNRVVSKSRRQLSVRRRRTLILTCPFVIAGDRNCQIW